MAAEHLNQPLPSVISNSAATYESREQFIVKFLESTLPSTDSKNVLEELKRTFFLDKHKAWHGKRKTQGEKTKNRSMRKFSGLKIGGKNHGLVYKDLLPLHDMWLDYIRQNLGCKDFNKLPDSPVVANWETINQRLLRADYHGAMVTVVRSKCPNSVGSHGIIVQETKNCFKIVTRKNHIKTLPKDASVFKFHLPNASLEVFGKELLFKPSERSVKKFKAIHLGEL